MSTSANSRDRRLKEIVREALGMRDDVRLARLTGGASRETFLVGTGATESERRYVLRIADSASVGSVSLDLESRALASARTAGVPVPGVHTVGTDDTVGGAYILMDHVPGETIARRILRDPEFAPARAGLAYSLGDALARIHTMDMTTPELTPAEEDPLPGLLKAGGRDDPPESGLALGIRWLRDHRPEPGPTCVVHGDFRLGNLIIDANGLRSVLDWELVHCGDPVEDLGWFCAKVWRFGSPLPAGGVGTREELLDGYAAVAGWRPSREQLRWWELYATIRWGLMCGVQADRHLSGVDPSVELVAIGRRSAEQEFDVLLALDLETPRIVPDILDSEPSVPVGPYGRPGIDDLVGGILLHLQGDVMPLGGRVGFNARVAANVTRTVLRELRLGTEHRRRHQERLSTLRLIDEADLSAAILSGTLDHRWDDVVAAVRSAVRDRLSVANPDHFARPA